MRRRVLSGAIPGVLICLLLSSATPIAQPLDYRTHFTFSGPVTVPGTTLPAGEYLFRIMNNHKVAEIASSDGKTSFSIFFVYPAIRSDVPNDPEVHFMETPANTPPAVRAWWITGERTGWEPVYPKEQAHLLAKGSNSPVLEASVNGSLASADVPEPTLEIATPAGGDVKLDDKNAPSTAGRTQKGTVSSSKAADAK